MNTDQFESDLIEAIQPIRNFVLASSIYHLFESGIFDRIHNWYDIKDLIKDLELEEQKLIGFLFYLRNENIVTIKDGKTKLTTKGASLSLAKSWYTMLIGGYGNTFLQIGYYLKKNTGFVERDITKVGIGSCGISYYDAFPLTKKLLNNLSFVPKSICDLGCGNGMYLTEFYKYFGNITLEGIESNEQSCEIARQYIQSKGLSAKIKIHCDDAVSFVCKNLSNKPDVFILGFVLHEILAQSGEDGLLSFLLTIKNNFPLSYIIIIEVNNQITNKSIMKHKLSEAYYNPYYLLHYFTNQKLEKLEFWENIFEKSGFEILANASTEENIDSTNLEIGYLLKIKT
jgi:2-ketoarginine methyltransferase